MGTVLVNIHIGTINKSVPCSLYLTVGNIGNNRVSRVRPCGDGGTPRTRLITLGSPGCIGRPTILGFLGVHRGTGHPTNTTCIGARRNCRVPRSQLTRTSFVICFHGSVTVRGITFSAFSFFLAHSQRSSNHQVRVRQNNFRPAPTTATSCGTLAKRDDCTSGSKQFCCSGSKLI